MQHQHKCARNVIVIIEKESRPYSLELHIMWTIVRDCSSQPPTERSIFGSAQVYYTIYVWWKSNQRPRPAREHGIPAVQTTARAH